MISSQEREQILQIVTNLYTTTKKVPFVGTLLRHPVYWQVFSAFSEEKLREVDIIIHDWIVDFLSRLTTKWGQLFARLLEIDAEKFWAFRELNADETAVDTPEFQSLWMWMEGQLFKLEWILTAQMLKKSQWLDKTVSAFYEIAYAMFPHLNAVESQE